LRDAYAETFPSVYPEFEKHKHLIGPQGEIVPLEGNRIELDYFAKPFGFMRIGNLAFLNDRLKPDIPQSLQDQFRAHAIWLSEFDSVFAEKTHLPYSILPIYALTTLNLAGKHVLDLGSADGILSLVAIKMGAFRVTSVDMQGNYVYAYERHLKANAFSIEGLDYIEGEFADAERILARLKSPKIDVAVANVGAHYGNAHMEAISLATRIPGLQTFIGGAYIRDHPDKNAQPSIDFLRARGYGANLRELSFKHRCVAFIVDRS
jgi:SAM-dependent methyltransferase